MDTKIKLSELNEEEILHLETGKLLQIIAEFKVIIGDIDPGGHGVSEEDAKILNKIGDLSIKRMIKYGYYNSNNTRELTDIFE